jgi:hypothetical protein
MPPHRRIEQHQNRDHRALLIFLHEVQAEISQHQKDKVRQEPVGVAQESHGCAPIDDRPGIPDRTRSEGDRSADRFRKPASSRPSMYANVVTTRQRVPCSGSNAGSSLPEAAATIARSRPVWAGTSSLLGLVRSEGNPFSFDRSILRISLGGFGAFPADKCLRRIF